MCIVVIIVHMETVSSLNRALIRGKERRHYVKIVDLKVTTIGLSFKYSVVQYIAKTGVFISRVIGALCIFSGGPYNWWPISWYQRC